MEVDFDIKEIELLNTYKKKLRKYRNICLVTSALIDRQIRKIKSDLEYISRNATKIEDKSSEVSQNLDKRYSDAIEEFGDSARSRIGQADLDSRHKLELLTMQERNLQQKIKELIVKMQNAGQRTKNFALQMSSLTVMCEKVIDRKTTFIDQYTSLSNNVQSITEGSSSSNSNAQSEIPYSDYMPVADNNPKEAKMHKIISKGLYIKCTSQETIIAAEVECVNYEGDFWFGKEDTYVTDFVTSKRFDALSCTVLLSKGKVQVINEENGNYRLEMVFPPLEKETKYIEIHNLCSWLELEEDLFLLSEFGKEERIM